MFWNFTIIFIFPAIGLRCYFINSFIIFVLSKRSDEKPENMLYWIKDILESEIRDEKIMFWGHLSHM